MLSSSERVPLYLDILAKRAILYFMKGLILSGGFGTRLRPLSYTGAKQLIPIANKPIIYYGIEALTAVGINDIGIVVGETKQEVQDVVGNGDKWQARIQYIPQEAPLGLAHAIKISRDFIADEPFVMYLGDNILNEIKECPVKGSNYEVECKNCTISPHAKKYCKKSGMV